MAQRPTAADVVREMARQHGMTQADVARRAGIAKSTVSALFAGTRQPTVSHIRALSQLFHVSPAVFF